MRSLSSLMVVFASFGVRVVGGPPEPPRAADGEAKPGRPAAIPVRPCGPDWQICRYFHPLDRLEHRGQIRLVAKRTTWLESERRTLQHCRLENGGGAFLLEDDSGREVCVQYVTSFPYSTWAMEFVRKVDERGKPRRHEVRFGGVRYFDRDGDGAIDAWYFEDRVPVEVRGDALIEVRDYKGGAFGDRGNAAKPGAEPPKPRVLGPEWMTIHAAYHPAPGGPPAPDDNPERKSVFRPGAVVSYRKDGERATRHTLLLDGGGGADVREQDDRSVVSIELIGKQPGDLQFRFKRHVDDKGRPTHHEIRFGPVTYFDLNGDGTIDCWTDARGGRQRTLALVERRFVEFADPAGNLFVTPRGSHDAWDVTRTTKYEFIGSVGRWTRVAP